MKISNSRLFGLILFILIAVLGCEQKFDNVIDSFRPDYQVVTVLPTDDIYYNSSDSLITISIQFINSVEGIQNVFCDIYASDDSRLNSNHLSLLDNGNLANGDNAADDKIYTNKFPLSQYNPNGVYNIKYFVTDNSNSTKEVAVADFNFNNGQNNVPPVISNLIMVDSTARNVAITFSVEVSDSNGLSDVKRVFYELYKPDGTQVFNSQGISQFPLFDDGNSGGDNVSKDGRYTTVLTFPNDVATGFWNFEFTAEDRAGELSNKIVKSVKVL